MDAISLVWLAVAFPLAGFLANGLLALRKPDAKGLVSLIGPVSVIAAFVVAVAVFLELKADPSAARVVTLWRWMEADRLHVDMAFQVDQLAAVLLLVITGVGSLIHLFSVGYMRSDDGYARYFSYLNLFVACMLVLVLGANLPVLFIGWEGVGLCSYLLIGFWYSDEANANAGKKAFIVNRIGDFGVLLAMFFIWHQVGTLDFHAITGVAPTAFPAGGAIVTTITLLLFLGCVGKSAQIPLYVWLPDAMAGPTPVSALIHAATMVTAGVYLIARNAVLFSLAPVTGTVVAGVGAATALFAALIGLKQYDIKKVLAYSTVSQLGYMFVAVGAGAYTAGIFHLVTHAFFKALLFLGAGSVIHAMHHYYHAIHSHDDPQDMRNMGGLAKKMPWTATLMGLATLAIAGVPPLSGFFSKDEILTAAFARSATDPIFAVFYAMALTAALLTAIYMARLFAMTFLGQSRIPDADREHVHEAPWIMTGPLAVLGVLTVVGGALNLPELVGGHHALETWLAPVFHAAEAVRGLELPAHDTELMLVGAAVLVGLVGLVVGARVVLGGRVLPAREAAPDRGLASVLAHKFYVDELYDLVIVKPTMWVSTTVLWKTIDRILVDGIAVMGLARFFQSAGWIGSRLQTGQVGLYVGLFVVGAVWILATVLR